MEKHDEMMMGDCNINIGEYGDNTLNVQKLYANGYDRLTLNHMASLEPLWDAVLNEEYYLENAWQVSRYASWESKAKQWAEPTHVPQVYQDFTKELLDSGMLDPYFDIHGKFNHIIYMLHHTARGYINPWHGHFLDGMHVHLLVHLGSDDRNPKVDGGLLEIGKIENPLINFKNYVNIGDESDIVKTGEVVSNHGELTVMLNSNPYFVHQVTRVLTDVPRYTLMLACGYKDNTLKTKSTINHI